MVEAIEPNAFDELRAILFGEGTYERLSAPEFSILADLAPVLSKEQLEYVLDALISMGAGVASEKRRVIGAMLAKSSNFTPEYLGSLALRAPGAIPYFSEAQAVAALSVIRETQSGRDIGYLDAIVGLSTRLSPEKALPVLLDEALTLAEALNSGGAGSQNLAWLISALAMRLSDTEARKVFDTDLQQVEQVARRIPDPYYRILSLISLAQLEPPEQRQRRLLDAWREAETVSDERYRAELQVIIASLLEGDDRTEAVELAFSSASALDVMDDLRLVLLVLLSLALEENPFDTAEASRGRIIAEGLSPYETGRILWPSAQGALVSALARMVGGLPPSLDDRFRRWVHSVELDVESPVLMPLTPYAAPEQIDRLLDQLGDIYNHPELQLEWLAWMADFLRGGQIAHALYVLREYVAPGYQWMGFATLLPVLTDEDLSAAEEFCRNMGDGWYGWRAWAALAERFPSLFASIPEAAAQVSGGALQRLWLQQPAETRDWLTRRMIHKLVHLYGGAAPPEAGEPRMASRAERLDTLPEAAPPPDEAALPRMKMEAPPAAEAGEGGSPLPAALYESAVAGTAAELPEEMAEGEEQGAGETPAEDVPTLMYSLPTEMMEEAPAEAAAEGEPPAAEIEEAFGAAPADAGAEPSAPLIPLTGGGEEEAEEAAPEEVAVEEEMSERLAAPAPQPEPAAPPQPSAGSFPSLLRRIESGERRRSAAYDYVGGEAPSKGVVSTGFAPQQKPDQAITDRAPLLPGGEYYFLFSIGARRRFDIAPPDRPIHAPLEKLPPKARLQVALFAFPGEIEITPGKDVGELELLPNRTVTVLKQVAEPASLSDENLLKQVLFFPVRMPAKPGSYRLRINLYCQGVLVQSYLVQAQALGLLGRLAHRLAGKRARPALETSLDYTLSNDLNTEVLNALEAHSLSLMINDNGNGTHGFRFFGGAGQELLKGDASFTGLDLQNLIEQGRGALRRVAWGETTEWEPSWNVEQRYRYFQVRSGDWKERLRADLVILAKWGWRFYTLTLRNLAEFGAGSQAEADERRERVEHALMSTSLIQIAAKESLRHVLPAALIYDYPIIDTFPSNMFSLCPEFTAALDAETPLEDTVCFQGACPSRGNLQVICPSGFWGYRHVLGLPVSIGADVGNLVVKITYKESPTLTAAFSTDFTLRANHFQKLHQLRTPLSWLEADTGQQTLEYLRTANPHLVYFYCHGGLTEEKVPYLQVGSKNDAWGLITPSVLPAMRIRWSQPRPLVFINGCHTTALEPEAALDMVSGFVRDAGAAGVVGTEITIFEPLATAFAEECLRQFLNGTPIGQAVRKARLKLLQEGNPLGLVYIPFAVASLAMMPE